jgi:hypothetical protein
MKYAMAQETIVVMVSVGCSKIRIPVPMIPIPLVEGDSKASAVQMVSARVVVAMASQLPSVKFRRTSAGTVSAVALSLVPFSRLSP